MKLTKEQQRAFFEILFGKGHKTGTEIIGFYDRYDGNKEYYKHIRPGLYFWHFTNDYDNELLGIKGGFLYGEYVRIQITFVRSNVAFFRYVDYPNVPEQHFDLGSVMHWKLHPEKLSLKEYGAESLKGITEWDTLDGRITIVD